MKTFSYEHKPPPECVTVHLKCEIADAQRAEQIRSAVKAAGDRFGFGVETGLPTVGESEPAAKLKAGTSDRQKTAARRMDMIPWFNTIGPRVGAKADKATPNEPP